MSKQTFYNSIFVLSLLFSDVHNLNSMHHDQTDHGVAQAVLVNQQVNEYDSDSEDEEGYTYQGLPELTFADQIAGKSFIPLARGIHFSPSYFKKQQRSALRKENDAGKDVYCSAAYDQAKIALGSQDEQGLVKKEALKIRDTITKLGDKRHRFQQVYSNQYDTFHKNLGTKTENGIFKKFKSKKNPQVSTAEDFFHATKYASGLKFLGSNIVSLDPEYDKEGKPKHPYVGKLSVILLDTDNIAQAAPYFVVHGHANNNISIYTHFSNDILAEREVSFPGLVEGKHVVLSVPIRVPSFNGDYKDYYQEKYGISERSYKYRKTQMKNGTFDTKKLLLKIILPHLSELLKNHLKTVCESNNAHLVYKKLDGSFGSSLPSLVNAKEAGKKNK